MRIEITSEPQDAALRAWFQPMLEQGSTYCAPNLQTNVAFVRTPHVELPLSFNDTEWDNSWICSPWTQYISYARQEIAWNVPRWISCLTGVLLTALGRWLRRADFNRVVMVNNWLLSTTPWPNWPAEELPELLQTLRERWPNHAIIFRSLNRHESAPLLEQLTRARVMLIPSRQVWWFAPDSLSVEKSRDYRKDVKLLRRPDLELIPHDGLRAEDFPRLSELYRQLYLEKYSYYNPQFSSEWLRYMHANDLLHFTALREPGGPLVGVEAYGVINGVLTSPFVGYDLSKPKEWGLYRRLAVLPIVEARRRQMPLNLSAGVGRYKALRGGEATLEYIAVELRHLPAYRRRPWRVVQWISQNMLAPVVTRWQL